MNFIRPYKIITEIKRTPLKPKSDATPLPKDQPKPTITRKPCSGCGKKWTRNRVIKKA